MPSPATLVQPIVLLIDKDAPPSHADAVRAAAAAAVEALAASSGDDPAVQELWKDWLSGPFTKTVRRANAKQWAKLPPADGQASFGPAHAAAFRPVSYENMDRIIARLQVSGTDLELADTSAPDEESPVLVMNSSLGMTTGKAAAQAAHALMAYYLGLGEDGKSAWEAGGRPFQLVEVDAGRFAALSPLAVQGTAIRDNGLTEVAPGSATALVIANWRDVTSMRDAYSTKQ